MKSDDDNSPKPPDPGPGEKENTAEQPDSPAVTIDIKGENLTLEQLTDKIEDLLAEREWKSLEIGLLVLAMDNHQLAEQERSLSTLEYLGRVFGELTASTLWRYACVAKYFNELHVYLFTMEKLYALIGYQRGIHGRVLSHVEPGDYVIQVPQKDGTFIAKKFRDCTLKEIPRSPKHLEKQGKKAAAQKAPEKVQVTKARPRSLWLGLVLFGLGSASAWLAQVIPWDSVAGPIRWLGGVLLFAGGFLVLAYLTAIRERWLAAVKDGSALALLSQRLATLIALPKAVGLASAALKAGTKTAVGSRPDTQGADGSKPAAEAAAAPEPPNRFRACRPGRKIGRVETGADPTPSSPWSPRTSPVSSTRTARTMRPWCSIPSGEPATNGLAANRSVNHWSAPKATASTPPN